MQTWSKYGSFFSFFAQSTYKWRLLRHMIFEIIFALSILAEYIFCFCLLYVSEKRSCSFYGFSFPGLKDQNSVNTTSSYLFLSSSFFFNRPQKRGYLFRCFTNRKELHNILHRCYQYWFNKIESYVQTNKRHRDSYWSNAEKI